MAATGVSSMGMEITRAVDASIAERLRQLAQRYSQILGGVMLVDVGVAGRLDAQI